MAYLEAIAARARDAAEVVVVDGEAGIGKTTLLRAWAGRRTAAGDTVLIASCGPLDRSMPLDALLTALAALLRGLGPDTAADVLGADAALLGPLLSLAPGPRLPPMLADSMLGPAVLYSALVRALRRLAEDAPLAVVIDDAHLAGPALPDWLRFARRENLAVLVVAAVRTGEGEPLPATAFVHLGALGRDAAAELVGPGGRRRVARSAALAPEPGGGGAGAAAAGGPRADRGGAHLGHDALAAVHRARARAGRPPGAGAGRVHPVHHRGGTAPGPALRRPRGELRRLGAAQPGRR